MNQEFQKQVAELQKVLKVEERPSLQQIKTLLEVNNVNLVNRILHDNGWVLLFISQKGNGLIFILGNSEFIDLQQYCRQL